MGTKLSIIVPVYNGEKYIASCLHSITKQLTVEAEVIVVNDGSLDNSGRIITELFNSYITSGQMIYLATSNAGVSAARNAGLELAQGDYVGFVDADDLVRLNYVSTIIKAMVESPDLIEFGYRSINVHGEPLAHRCYIHTEFGEHRADVVIDTIFAACLWYPFLRVIKRTIFANIRFPVGMRFGEDIFALSAVYKCVESILSLPDVLYDYRLNPDGATQNKGSDYAINLIDFYRKIPADPRFLNKALKINLAYAIRGCIRQTTDPLGRMPKDIESDVRKLIFTPRLFFKIRLRFYIYALFGPTLFYIQRYMR